jgi:hypothetical protein
MTTSKARPHLSASSSDAHGGRLGQSSLEMLGGSCSGADSEAVS